MDPARRIARALAGTAAATVALVATGAPTSAQAAPGKATFAFDPQDPGIREWVVPTDVCQVRASLHGAAGGRTNFPGDTPGQGQGATVVVDLAVAPGQTLYVVPGGSGESTLTKVMAPPDGSQPGPAAWLTAPGGVGGDNGGGDGGDGGGRHTGEHHFGGGAGGGGATDLRTSPAPADRIAVAGGGGGSGSGALDPATAPTGEQVGGDGGDPATAGAHPSLAGSPGTPTGPGAGGPGVPGGPAGSGTDTDGGDGSSSVDTGDLNNDGAPFGGGGGGGGWYGGGGGGAVGQMGQLAVAGGGGGGSSHVTGAATLVSQTTGNWAKEGLAELAWTPDPGCDVAVPITDARALAVYAAAGGLGALLVGRRLRRRGLAR